MISSTIIPEQLYINKIMGGKMNLNPLKKDDNTDALVKALEDANNVGTADGAVQPVADPAAQFTDSPVTDGSVIAADPQITGEPVLPATDDSTPTGVADSTDTTDSTDSATGITFDGNDLPAGLSSDADAHLPATASEGTGENGELDGVKKSALEQLRPLIEKLDLEPADKFDKYLMMLRASDDPALIKPAFDAAQGISGEKEKAQALLDIINEINYITANQQS
jgi:hypothetical protein